MHKPCFAAAFGAVVFAFGAFAFSTPALAQAPNGSPRRAAPDETPLAPDELSPPLDETEPPPPSGTSGDLDDASPNDAGPNDASPGEESPDGADLASDGTAEDPSPMRDPTDIFDRAPGTEQADAGETDVDDEGEVDDDLGETTEREPAADPGDPAAKPEEAGPVEESELPGWTPLASIGSTAAVLTVTGLASAVGLVTAAAPVGLGYVGLSAFAGAGSNFVAVVIGFFFAAIALLLTPIPALLSGAIALALPFVAGLGALVTPPHDLGRVQMAIFLGGLWTAIAVLGPIAIGALLFAVAFLATSLTAGIGAVIALPMLVSGAGLFLASAVLSPWLTAFGIAVVDSAWLGGPGSFSQPPQAAPHDAAGPNGPGSGPGFFGPSLAPTRPTSAMAY